MQVVHTAELHFSHLSHHLTHIAVGQMIAGELRIRHTRKWCSQEYQETDSPLEFMYEIYANPESWLVGGRKRGNFTAVEGETKTFSIMLVAQRPGHLLLPAVDIKAFVQPPQQQATATTPDSSTSAAGEAASFQRRQISCEVDYRNLGQTLLVLPDLRRTTVSLSHSGSGGSSWLVDSEAIHSSQVT